MPFVPLWKIKRELRRPWEQFLTTVRYRSMVEHFRRSYHETNAERLLRETPGTLPLTSRVAVFVLFQPKGIAKSTFLTLEHLAQEGWSVLVVSNAPLSPQDLAQLVANCGHVIERPNFGYDFGAYREGWRWLHAREHKLDRLILMNDSTWFPLRRQDDSLRRMEALNVDLAGHIFKTEKSDDPTFDHIESHLLMFGPRALANADTRQFWSDYRMSDSRVETILKGEIALSQSCLRAGLVVNGLLDREKLLSILGSLPDDVLFVVAKNTVVTDAADHLRREKWTKAASAGQPWRDDYTAWVDKELAASLFQPLSATFVDPAIKFGGMGFLKKSNDRRFQLARMRMLHEIDHGRISPFDPVVMDELRANVENWKEPSDWRRDPHSLKDPLIL